jgi:hypothetical protein
MRLRRIRIQDFRKLRGPVSVDGLGDGLTVIAGDNEDGKSTLLEAIRAALFCRHRASDDFVRSLAPFGCAGARPVVELVFEINGLSWHLRKAFCHKPHEALLTAVGGGGGVSFKGDAAEEELGRLLGLPRSNRGATKTTDQGIWGLFWVSQGTAFDTGGVLSDGSRLTLTRALEDELGRVLGGDTAPALLARIRHRCDELFSESRNVARGELKLARDAKDAADNEVARLKAALTDYRGKLAELQRLREERARLDGEQTLAQAEAAVRAAEQEQRWIEELQQREQQEARKAELAHARFDQARAVWRARYDAIQAARAATDEEAALMAELTGARRRLEPAKALLAQAEAELEAARRRQQAAEARLAGAERALRRARLRQVLESDSEALRRAEAAEAAALQAAAAAAAIPVDDAAMVALRAGVAAAVEAAARLDAAATQVVFTPEAGQRAFIEKQEVPPGQPLRLAAEAVVQLEGFGTIIIRPGGEDLGERQRKAAVAEAAVVEMLARSGTADAGAAEAAHALRHRHLAAAENERRAVATLAPQGLAVLRAAVAAKAAELTALPLDAAGEPPLADAEAAADAAWREREDAACQLSTRQQMRDDRAGEAAQAGSAEVSARTRAETSAVRSSELHRALADARSTNADQTLLTTLKDEEANVAAADALLEQGRDALRRCEPEAVAERLAAAQRLLAEAQERRRRLDKEISDGESELRGRGHFGIEDELAAAQGTLQRAERKLAVVEEDAAAVRLLYDTLRTAEQEAKRSFAEPITRRMSPYLRTLFPGCELDFASDTLELRHLRRAGCDEPFSRLSVGTREQLAVLTRLAFAELLSERGQPAAVILDDALVYSDRSRLQRMQAELLRAAERVQVIVLTCRPGDYASLGAPVIRLADCVAEPVG